MLVMMQKLKQNKENAVALHADILNFFGYGMINIICIIMSHRDRLLREFKVSHIRKFFKTINNIV
jgi:hypothetical protein